MAEDQTVSALLLELADRFDRGELIGQTPYAGRCAIALRAAFSAPPVEGVSREAIRNAVHDHLKVRHTAFGGVEFLGLDKVASTILALFPAPQALGGGGEEKGGSSRSQPCGDAGSLPALPEGWSAPIAGPGEEA